ncbi:MAG: hypothetical protein TREMPRED_004464 [Tremellales sp. Tagirdzhanova-0007]|nr:MAG: hypothetical protein TREMPRED_004464 [Tremellales sp. Tagirdzhanova-0007]
MTEALRYVAAEALNFPKDFKHLGPRISNPVINRANKRKGYVQPRDRIKLFNIHPGDRVRLLVGKDQDKFVDEQKGVAGGWKLYTVKKTEPQRSRVYLEGLANRGSAQPRPKPLDYDLRTEEEQAKWQQATQIRIGLRPVHYSNLSLLVEEDTEDPTLGGNEDSYHIFATKLATGKVFKAEGQLRWERYAARMTGPTNLEPLPHKNMVSIQWPKKEKVRNITPASNQDAERRYVQQTTLIVPDRAELGSSLSKILPLLPLTTRSPPPTDQAISDMYINNPDSRSEPMVDVLMPLFLSEELAPRFAKHKISEAWKHRQDLLKSTRMRIGEDSVKAWELGGRDAGLRDVMDSDEAGLEGVPLRPRSVQEVREAALAEVDEEVERERKFVKSQIVSGMVWDSARHMYVRGDKAKQKLRKRLKKQKKAVKLEQRLSNLKLKPGKNMVLPPSLVASDPERAIGSP